MTKIHASNVSESICNEFGTKENIWNTQRPGKYVKKLQNEIHHYESRELAAIMDTV